MSGKPHSISVRVLDGKPREWQKLKGLLGSHLDVRDLKDKIEFVVSAVNEKQIAQVREKLGTAGLEEFTPEKVEPFKKPYGFVSLPQKISTFAPIWHDGTSSKGLHSGEIRFELETLTPLLVGWERGQVGDNESDWPLPASLAGTQLANKKSVLCPLRAPWGKYPVVIPGDSLKGLLRHELGALLVAPMERVAERSYSYRPNSLFPNQPNPRLIARIARVPNDGVEMQAARRGVCPRNLTFSRWRRGISNPTSLVGSADLVMSCAPPAKPSPIAVDSEQERHFLSRCYPRMHDGSSFTRTSMCNSLLLSTHPCDRRRRSSSSTRRR